MFDYIFMTIIKKIAQYSARLCMLPLTLLFWLLSIIAEKNSLVSSFSQLLSLIPGKIGSYLRIGFYRFILQHCHDDSMISFGVLFSQADTEIYSGVYIGPQSNIGSCVIEKNCLLGSAVHILSGKRQHNYSQSGVPLSKQGGTFEKITIGENTWIGNGAIVMANVGKDCVIGAGSVVTHKVADNSIMSGNPAMLIKQKSGVAAND